MLKSTYRPTDAALQSKDVLPFGWSEHVAPTGHRYYYNTETKQSTYIHPSAILTSPLPPASDAAALNSVTANTPPSNTPLHEPDHRYSSLERTRPDPRGRHDQRRNDRPKTKQIIPSCTQWLLITTRLGRRFVHNLETGESFWKFPKDVLHGVVELDDKRRRNAETSSSSAHTASTKTSQRDVVVDTQATIPTKGQGAILDSGGQSRKPNESIQASSDEEYEEIEVTDDDSDTAQSSKRQKLGAEPQEHLAAELGEDDMAFQLAQMEEAYTKSNDIPEDYEEPSQHDTWTDEDARVAFQSLLDDYSIDPFTTWDSVLEAGLLIEDERYTYVSTMRGRRDAFAEWSAAKIQDLKEQKRHQARQNPRIPYLNFLQKHAAPRLFWTEFRRKFKAEPDIKSTQMTDKEREKLYREHINRVTKVPEPTLKADLEALLRSITPSANWNKSVNTHDPLPTQLLADIRYISLPAVRRDQIIREFISTLPEVDDAMSAEERDIARRQQVERERQVAALKSRQVQVDDARRRQLREVNFERMRMEQGDHELQQALEIGKGGLLADISRTGKNVQREQ